MTDAQRTAIEKHGRKLLVIFPHATERDPVKLCKKLRRLEETAHKFAERLCNGPEFGSEEEQDAVKTHILDKVYDLLGDGPPVFLNQDPRGYALKIRDEHARGLDIYKDWGGYGIIAPEIGKDGN